MIKFFVAAMLAAFMSLGAYAGTTIKTSQLPAASRQFITKYFPGDNIRKAEQDQGYRGVEYDVDLVSGAEIEFGSDGNWRKVEAAKGKAVPSGIVPSGIAKYVSTNHKGAYIKEISRKRRGYEVELSNGTELHLTEQGIVFTPRQGGGKGAGKGNRPKNK